MSAKHTPRPWTFGVRKDGSIWLSLGDHKTGPHYQGDLVATPEDARLIAAAPELLEALEAHQAAQAMPIYGDYSDFVWPKLEMRKPGEPAWGWICEKHGLGYQGGCICCSDDFKRHQDNKDRAARYARDNALNEASNKARAAIRKATGEQA